MKYVICIHNIGNYEKYINLSNFKKPVDIDAYLFVDEISQKIKLIFEKMKWNVVILNSLLFNNTEFVKKFRIMSKYCKFQIHKYFCEKNIKYDFLIYHDFNIKINYNKIKLFHKSHNFSNLCFQHRTNPTSFQIYKDGRQQISLNMNRRPKRLCTRTMIIWYFSNMATIIKHKP